MEQGVESRIRPSWSDLWDLAGDIPSAGPAAQPSEPHALPLYVSNLAPGIRGGREGRKGNPGRSVAHGDSVALITGDNRDAQTAMTGSEGAPLPPNSSALAQQVHLDVSAEGPHFLQRKAAVASLSSIAPYAGKLRDG